MTEIKTSELHGSGENIYAEAFRQLLEAVAGGAHMALAGVVRGDGEFTVLVTRAGQFEEVVRGLAGEAFSLQLSEDKNNFQQKPGKA